MTYSLMSLPYAYTALEPHIDAMTMEIHHSKHHQAYVNNLNAALEKHPELNLPLEKLLADYTLIPEDIRMAVRNNGGGTYNHNLFWENLSPVSQKPSEKLLKRIEKDFGSFDAFKEKFETAAKTRFGSGWAWLIVKKDHTLDVVSTPNQDVPLDQGHIALALDVWEHAYYLKYQNRRPDYISAFWNVVNWEVVEKRVNAAV